MVPNIAGILPIQINKRIESNASRLNAIGERGVMSEKCVTVTIKNFETYQVRKHGYKRAWWFSVSNNICLDPDVWDLSHGEFRAWIYVLSRASEKGKGTVEIRFDHAERIAGIERKYLVGLIEKFSMKSILTGPAQDLSNVCAESAQDLDATNKQTNTQTHMSDSKSDVSELVSVWNLNCGSLAKVSRCDKSSKRGVQAKARLKDNPDLGYWETVVKRIAKSDFCNGQSSTGWKADFSFLVQPETHIKALEGKYDNKTISFPGNSEPKNKLRFITTANGDMD